MTTSLAGWLTPIEAADLVKVHPRTLLTAIARGELRAVRLGRRTIRIHPDDLDAWMQARPVSGGAA